jgi:hypothetical protein
MTDRESKELVASCECGQVVLEARGAPIIGAVCYCRDCQRGGGLLQAPRAPAVVGPDGGTEYVLYRKDRVRLVKGADLLEEQRLVPESPTRRVRAACCHSAMFLDMTKGHWLSIYRRRFRQEDAPPIEVRAMTKDRPAGVELAEDVPISPRYSGKFMWRLLGARFAMGLSVPKLGY